MILEAAIISLTRNLDVISQQESDKISSNSELKQKGLNCLISLIENAPQAEYLKLLTAEGNELLLGYLVNVLCQISKNDKSKSIRSQAISIILALVNRLEDLHDESHQNCSIRMVSSGLPGVSSTLFKLITSDTKLPRNLLVVAIKTLSKFITVAFSPCNHNSNPQKLTGQTLIETCDNLAIRIAFLIDYVTDHSSHLPEEVKNEVLELCNSIVCGTTVELVKRTLNTIVKYMAFISSRCDSPQDIPAEIQLKLMLIIDNVKDKIQNCDNECDRLDSVVLTCLFKLLDGLESNWPTMLPGELHSELSVLYGFLKLLTKESLIVFLEFADKRDQLFSILTTLTEFASNQPFLFLTNSNIGDQALETIDERIYTAEKRFRHITNGELIIISNCCRILAQSSDWLCVSNLFGNELGQFSSPSNLYITYLILRGYSEHSELSGRFASSLLNFYLDNTQDQYRAIDEILVKPRNESVDISQDLLKVVIAIETIVVLVGLHVNSKESSKQKIFILKNLLCPLLSWSSSSSRPISEAGLSALREISRLYELDSTKSLIERNIDYVVDGVGMMLDNFAQNSEATNVLAITFNLSSIENFYYFRDVYEKVFKLLGEIHHTERSKSIALLFYRTISILNEWRNAKQSQVGPSLSETPLKCESSLKSILYDLDIQRRLRSLEEDTMAMKKMQDRMKYEDGLVTESKVLEEFNSGAAAKEVAEDLRRAKITDQSEVEETKKKEKSIDIQLTETILRHCINLVSSNYDETKILALKTAACALNVIRDDDDTLLPLVHQLWSPLCSRLIGDYQRNLEINICAFDCLVSMAVHAKDFIKRRTLDAILPRLCLFLESQAGHSKGKKHYGPYCMTAAYKCQLQILTGLGELVYHIDLAYSSLWRVISSTLIYMDANQEVHLREAAIKSLHYLIALDADCVWYFAKKCNQLENLPFNSIYDLE